MMDPFTQILDTTQETDNLLPNIKMSSNISRSKILKKDETIVENPDL